MLQMSAEEFEELVADAMDELPEPVVALVQNCVLVVEDADPQEPGLLGLYEGVPLTEREANFTGHLPDVIHVYRLPTLALCRSREEVAEEVLTTVVHEVAHVFGIDDERLHELGWG